MRLGKDKGDDLDRLIKKEADRQRRHLENSFVGVGRTDASDEGGTASTVQPSPLPASARAALPSVTEETHLIILTDIMNFSMKDSFTEMYYISLFQMYVRFYTRSRRLACEDRIHVTGETGAFLAHAGRFDFGDQVRITHFIPTGDGCYMIADECDAGNAVDFLLTLIAGFQQVLDMNGNSIPIRVSALIGKCIPFYDLTGHKNYLGSGMNEASRILSCGQHATEDALKNEGGDVKRLSSNTLYLGDSLAAVTENQKTRATRCLTFKDLPDKHGMTRNVTVLQGIKMYCPLRQNKKSRKSPRFGHLFKKP